VSDPLDKLRNAWRGLNAPDLEAGADDRLTRASVDWMRAAWAGLEAPAYPASTPVPAPAPHPLPRAVSIASGLAAAWLALLAVGQFAPPRGERPTPVDPRDPTPFHASFRPASIPRDGVAELRAGAVTLVLLDESASPYLEPDKPSSGDDR
jgi:hypothetical protein